MSAALRILSYNAYFTQQSLSNLSNFRFEQDNVIDSKKSNKFQTLCEKIFIKNDTNLSISLIKISNAYETHFQRNQKIQQKFSDVEQTHSVASNIFLEGENRKCFKSDFKTIRKIYELAICHVNYYLSLNISDQNVYVVKTFSKQTLICSNTLGVVKKELTTLLSEFAVNQFGDYFVDETINSYYVGFQIKHLQRLITESKYNQCMKLFFKDIFDLKNEPQSKKPKSKFTMKHSINK